MLTFITFAIDIGKQTQAELESAFLLLHNSLSHYNRSFKLYCYTNLQSRLLERPCVIPIRIEESDLAPAYENRWNNLSFNKLKVVANHLSECPIWIDLDTVVCADLGFLEHVSSFVVSYNLPIPRKLVFDGVEIHGKDYFLGNFWKLDAGLHRAILNLAKPYNQGPPHDIQDYIALAHRIDSSIAVKSKDVTDLVFNWEWCYAHPFPDIIAEKLLHDGNGFITSDGRRFGIITFTFPSLLENIRCNWNSIRHPRAREVLIGFSEQ